MTNAILGIDVSKKELSFTLLIETKIIQKKFSNTIQGFDQLSKWLCSNKINHVKACMEATGSYGEKIADFLCEAGHDVHVVNPVCIKSFAKSKLNRHKTDEVDSLLIAEFASKNDLRLYKPKNSVIKELRALYKCSQNMKLQKAQTSNFLENEELLPQTVKSCYNTNSKSIGYK